MPLSIPTAVCNTSANGAKQFVVQLALLTTSSSAVIVVWFTPYTTVRLTLLAGALISTLRAPFSVCMLAVLPSLYAPVHSSTMSTLGQSHAVMSRTWLHSTSSGISTPLRPCTLSYLYRCVFVSTSPVALIFTICISGRDSRMCRVTQRPILPNPFMPILILPNRALPKLVQYRL